MADQTDDTFSRRSVLKLTATGFALGAAGTGAAQSEERAAEVAKATVAEETGTDPEQLTVVTENLASYEHLEEEFYDAKVFDETTGAIHTVRIDEAGERVDASEVRKRAREAREEQHGKLTAHLDDRVAEAAADEEIPITVFTEGVDRGQARRAAGVAGEAPTAAAREALSKEVVDRISRRTERLGRKLEAQRGVTVVTAESASPSVLATATPDGIERIERLPEVRRVFLRSTEVSPDLDEASQTHKAGGGQQHKFDATGHKVGIYDVGNPGDSHQYFDVEQLRTPSYYTSSHANWVSMCAASSDDAEPGMAKNADVYAAAWGNASDANDVDDTIAWFEQNDVPVVNCSWSDNSFDHTDRTLKESDIRWDKYSMNRDLTVVHSAGNYNNSDTYNVCTPARGFNTIAAGNVIDWDTGDDRRDDERFDETDNASTYINPLSEHTGDHTKPEVSAVGADISLPTGRTFDDDGGTSFSAPQITGLVALFQKWADTQAEADLVKSADVARAIVFAATSNAGHWNENELGVGTIRPPLAKEIVENDQYVVDKMGQSESTKTYTLDDVEEGETVTVVASWLSDHEQEPWSDVENARSEIDLDLRADSPDSNYIHTSYNSDRGYEWVRFQVPGPSSVEVDVINSDWESPDTEREFCLAWSRATDTDPPQQPTNLTVVDHDEDHVRIEWDEVNDEGGSGIDGNHMYVDGWKQGRSPTGGTASTASNLAPGKQYTFGVSMVDEAGNESPRATIDHSTDSVGELYLHDFDGSPSWPGGNELGNWATADQLENGSGEIDRQALVLDYNSAGWFKSEVQQDVSDYTELKMRVLGTAFQGDSFSLSFGGVSDLFEELATTITGELYFRDVTIDMVDSGMDRTNPGDLELNFWDGADLDGYLAISEIWFE